MSKILPEKKGLEVPFETSNLIHFGRSNTQKERDFDTKSAHNLLILKKINHFDTKSAQDLYTQENQ